MNKVNYFGSDFRCHYDISHGFFMSGGKDIMLPPGGEYRQTDSCTVPEDGTYFIQFEADSRLESRINGITEAPDAIKLNGVIRSFPVPLKQGKNALELVLINRSQLEISADFQLRLCDDEGNLVRQEEIVPTSPRENEAGTLRGEPDLTGFVPGAGACFKTIGRFGFTKGDGLLDYSMPVFGTVAKPYIYGFPRYQKSRMWRISVLPDDLKPAGDHRKIYRPGENESIEADWSHVTWRQQDFTLDYSIHCGELLIETMRTEFSLSQLKGSAACRRIVLPLQGKTVTRPDHDGLFYDRETDGPLSENWVMFYGNSEFPEVPVQLIFRTSPKQIRVERIPGNRARSITVSFDGPIRWSMLTFPFGFEVFDPVEFDDRELERGIRLCRLRSATALARITACREYYKVENGQVRVIQKFEYRIFADEFGTKPLYCAVLPPPVSLARTGCGKIQMDPDARSLGFPTKYGELYGVLNSAWSEYTLPVPPLRREFPIQKGTKSEIASDFEAFLKFYDEKPFAPNPGIHYFLFPYVMTMTVFNELTPDEREKLLKILRQNLKDMLDPDFRYTGPRGLKAHPWYERREPFSGVSWLFNYLHVFSNSRLKDFEHETVSRAETPYIEVDWGNGLALYSIWLAALFTGDWELIRQRWDVIRGAFQYFLSTMDWACMCAPYCENGIAWSDGTNYGAYLGFCNMAEMIGDRDAYQTAVAAFAKMAVHRLALNAAAEVYLPRYFHVEPWCGNKVFPEELSCATQTTCYPAGRLFGKYRMETLYNMTTEGMYPEAFAMYADFDGERLDHLLTAFEDSQEDGDVLHKLPDGEESIFHSVGRTPGEQEIYSYLLLLLFSGRKTDREMLDLVNKAKENGRLAREILGVHEFSFRRVPAEFAWISLRDMVQAHSLPRLTRWKNLEIRDAKYPDLEVRAEDGGWIEFTSEKPLSATFNGQPVSAESEGSYYRFHISGCGILKIHPCKGKE